MNATVTAFELKDVKQVMDLRVFESALGSQGVIPLFSGHPNLKINILHRSYTIIFYPFLFHFYISCSDQAGIKET